jgi:cytochrome c oxidase subunit 2
MSFYVFADPPGVFRRWLAREARPATRKPPALFMSECSSCHAIRGTSASARVGPDLTHVGSRTSLAALTIPNSPARMAEWLSATQHVKPGALMPDLNLTHAQVSKLTRYLESLR